jgi:hypothetical protein
MDAPRRCPRCSSDEVIRILYIDRRWKFSEVWAVASRNRLYQILATNVALGTGQRAKSCSPRPIGTGVRDKAGEIATANFREFLFHAVG